MGLCHFDSTFLSSHQGILGNASTAILFFPNVSSILKEYYCRRISHFTTLLEVSSPTWRWLRALWSLLMMNGAPRRKLWRLYQLLQSRKVVFRRATCFSPVWKALEVEWKREFILPSFSFRGAQMATILASVSIIKVELASGIRKDTVAHISSFNFTKVSSNIAFTSNFFCCASE